MHSKFTLIELLVVIAIIGILTSILLPELAKVRQKGFQTVCLNNTRQATLAVIMYADKNNLYAPGDYGDRDERWFYKLQPTYLPNGKELDWSSTALSCPVAKDISSNWESQIALNSYISGKNQDGQTIKITSLTAASSETAIFLDAYDNWRSTKSNYMDVSKLITAEEGVRIAKHNLKSNVSFFDGSAKAIPVTILLQYNSPSHTFWDPTK